MNWLNFDIRKGITIAVILLLPLVSINTQQSPAVSGWYDRPFSFLAGVIETSFFHFSDSIRGTTKMYIDLINLKKESANLKQQNNALHAQMLAMDEIKKENERLNNLLSFRQKAKMDLVAAHIISRDLLSDHSTVKIDKGTAQGLTAGMSVITTEGVVGYVFRPEKFTAQILLITDRYSVVDGIVSRSRARGIVEGKSHNLLQLQYRYVEKSEDIKKDDIIVTSGLDNIFPKGFPVAIVDSVENKSFAVSLKVELRPLVDPNRVEEVFVVLNAKNFDMSDQLPSSQSFEQKTVEVK